ncbi:MAG: MarR family winged helix-turn-helix transcriptional regulator [Methanosarcinaceae archaeon]
MNYNSPATVPQSIGGLIAHIHRHDLIDMAGKLESYDLGIGQFGFLMALYHRDGIRQEELARYMGLSRPSATRAVQKLEDTGYVTRQRDSTDRRAMKVSLTEKGQRMRSLIKSTAEKRDSTLLLGFSDDESEMLVRLLRKVLHNVMVEDHTDE